MEKPVKKQKERALPLKWSLYVMIVICWVLPLSATLAISGLQIERNSRIRIEDTILSSASHAVSILEERFDETMADSRTASYDGKLREAYERYLAGEDTVALYDDTYSYLMTQYAHNSLFRAVYLIYSDLPEIQVHSFNRTLKDRVGAENSFEAAVGKLLEGSRNLGTRIAFFPIEGELFMVRNIVNTGFDTFAVLIMQCSQEYLFESAANLVWVRDAAVVLDGESIPVMGGQIPEDMSPGLMYDQDTETFLLNQPLDVDNHEVEFHAVVSGDLLAQEQSDLYTTLLIMVLSSGLLFAALVHFFYSNISRPVDALVVGMEHLEEGELGYHAEGIPGNREFQYLGDRFNDLSDQLKELFERNNMEQMALHDARIKALQSQINPHFLNNTLELINWEARMADNKKVCQMIESLSVMLDAAMSRGGKATVNMKEELSYIEAYLYIISQRFGDRLRVLREIEEDVWEAEVPRLILQPIVENAIEHGISHLAHGSLLIRLYRQEDKLIMDVEHDGAITPKDRETIDKLLNWDGKEYMQESSAHIGIRNVNQRLKILYGPESGLSLEETALGHVRNRICIPFIKSKREPAV